MGKLDRDGMALALESTIDPADPLASQKRIGVAIACGTTEPARVDRRMVRSWRVIRHDTDRAIVDDRERTICHGPVTSDRIVETSIGRSQGDRQSIPTRDPKVQIGGWTFYGYVRRAGVPSGLERGKVANLDVDARPIATHGSALTARGIEASNVDREVERDRAIRGAIGRKGRNAIKRIAAMARQAIADREQAGIEARQQASIRHAIAALDAREQARQARIARDARSAEIRHAFTARSEPIERVPDRVDRPIVTRFAGAIVDDDRPVVYARSRVKKPCAACETSTAHPSGLCVPCLRERKDGTK